MLNLSAKVTLPQLDIKTPEDPAFWTAVALDVQKDIRKRTETQKLDADGRAFKGYSAAYEKKRAKAGRSTAPNLSFTGKMLGAMRASGQHGKGTITLSGQEGLKAWGNEERGREFFSLSTDNQKAVFKRVLDWLTKKNGLK